MGKKSMPQIIIRSLDGSWAKEKGMKTLANGKKIDDVGFKDGASMMLFFFFCRGDGLWLIQARERICESINFAVGGWLAKVTIW